MIDCVSLPNGGGVSPINSRVSDKIRHLQNAIPYSEDLMNRFSTKIAVDKVTRELEHQFDISQISIPYEIEAFVKSQRSEATGNDYRGTVNQFVSYCAENGINILDLTAKNVDGFLQYLQGKYSVGSVVTKMRGCSSFFKFLLHRYPDTVKHNPFFGRKLPKNAPSRRRDFPTDNDIRELKKELRRLGRLDLMAVVDILGKYGYRVGIFQNMVVDCNTGKWSSDSKGQDYKGRFTPTETKNLLENNALSLKISTIKVSITRYTKKLYDKGVISCPFSAHDMRHSVIKKGVNNCKDGAEIVSFSRRFHKNLATTMGYLE
jgi:integrase